MRIKVVLVDDHLMFRQTLVNFLEGITDFIIVAQAGTGRDALRIVSQYCPDVLVLDIKLPDMSGADVARELSKKCPETRVLVLTGYADKVFVHEMFKAGVAGYVVKSAGGDELVAAIRAVATGRHFLGSDISSVFIRTDNVGALATTLTPRERQVLKLLAAGQSSAEIGGVLGIKESTVEVHRRNLKAKLNLRNTADLTRYAVREGFLAA